MKAGATYDPTEPGGRNQARIERTFRYAAFLYDRYFRCETEGIENVPREGPAILFGNHCGSTWTMEAPLLTVALLRKYGLDHPLYYLAHRAFFDVPGVREWMIEHGAVLADRATASKVLARGGQLITFPGGDMDSHKPFSDRHRVDFFGHKGFIRLSLRERVPLVPFVHVGTHETLFVLSRGAGIARFFGLDRRIGLRVFPINLSFPLGITVGPYFPAIPLPSKIRIRVLPACRLWEQGLTDPDDEEGVQNALGTFTRTMQGELDDLARGRRFLLG